MRVRWGKARHSRGESGLTVLEVTIAFTIVSTVLLASAGAFTSTINATRSAQSRSRGTVFLDTVMEDMSAQSYSGLLAFNGNKVYDGPTVARSNYSVDITSFLGAVDLIQVQGVLKELRTNREIGRVTSLRTNR
jgi:Tfp pilus assembly protein PilV